MEKYGEILDDNSISDEIKIESSFDNNNINNTRSINEKNHNHSKYISDDEKGK